MKRDDLPDLLVRDHFLVLGPSRAVIAAAVTFNLVMLRKVFL